MAAGTRRRPTTSRHRMSWREWKLDVRHTPNYLADGTDHVEVIVKAPAGAPLPITATGYRSHYHLEVRVRRCVGEPVQPSFA